MAKKNRRSGSKKHYPVQKRIVCSLPLPQPAGSAFVMRYDKLASNVNHRLYRQSRNYCLKVDIDADLPDGGIVEVYALQDTWMNMKAYQLAKATFDENSMEELEQLGSSRARWNDFRVDHGFTATEFEAEGFGSAGSARYTAGEYVLSEVSDAAGTANTFRWVGTGGNTFNIIDEYDATGNTDATPSSVLTAVAYDGLTDEVDDAQMEHLSDDGNNPPYSNASIENQVFVKVATLHVDSTGTSKLSTGYFNAPCGLVYLNITGGLDGNNIVSKIAVESKGGDYKGVHAPSYLE